MQDRVQRRHDSEVRNTKTVEESPQRIKEAETVDTDRLLEEIDAVLQEDPQVFLNTYIQEGGE